jgi:hypothetical protein
MKRNMKYLAGIVVLTLAGSGSASARGGSSLPAANPVVESPSGDVVLSAAVKANNELVPMVQYMDFAPAAVAYQKVTRDEVQRFADLTAEMPSLLSAIKHMRGDLSASGNIEKASQQIQTIGPLLQGPEADREINGVRINPGDPLRSPMELTVQAPLQGGYDDMHPIVYMDLTVGDMAYWTAFYNLRRAQIEVKKELLEFMSDVAFAQHSGVVDGNLYGGLNYTDNMAAQQAKWKAFDAKAKEWLDDASKNPDGADMEAKAEGVLQKAAYEMPESR